MTQQGNRTTTSPSISLTSICHSNIRTPAFNFKKAHWDKFQKIITEHPFPPLAKAQDAAKASIPWVVMVAEIVPESIEKDSQF